MLGDAENDRASTWAMQMESENNWYAIGFIITAAITFVVSWIYCVATYGFLLGVGLGWLPSAIVAFLAGLFWPLIAVALVAILFLLLFLLFGNG